MIIERNGVRLIRLTEDKIELVREKRNLPKIQGAMEYREYITAEMQQRWFASIDNIHNYYFLISVNSVLIGLISAADIDWEQRIINNGGIFVWDERYLESQEIMHASLLLTDVGFCMGIEHNYVKVLNSNKQAIAYNIGMGYELLPGQAGSLNQKYELHWSNYFSKTEKVRRLLKVEEQIVMTVTEEEYIRHKVLERVNARKPMDGFTGEMLVVLIPDNNIAS